MKLTTCLGLALVVGCGKDAPREVVTVYVEAPVTAAPTATATAGKALDPSRLTDAMRGQWVLVRANAVDVKLSADNVPTLWMTTSEEDNFYAGLVAGQKTPPKGPVTVRCKFLGWRSSEPLIGEPFGDECTIVP